MSEDTTCCSATLQRGKRGSAMIVTVLVLTIVTFLAVSGLRNTERESSTGARSRTASRTLAAADAGLQVALNQLSQAPVNLNSFDIDLADGANVQSRTRTDGAPQDLTQSGFGLVEVEEGYSIGAGSAVGFVNRIYLVNTTATSGGSTVELQAKLSVSEVAGVGY